MRTKAQEGRNQGGTACSNGGGCHRSSSCRPACPCGPAHPSPDQRGGCLVHQGAAAEPTGSLQGRVSLPSAPTCLRGQGACHAARDLSVAAMSWHVRCMLCSWTHIMLRPISCPAFDRMMLRRKFSLAAGMKLWMKCSQPALPGSGSLAELTALLRVFGQPLAEELQAQTSALQQVSCCSAPDGPHPDCRCCQRRHLANFRASAEQPVTDSAAHQTCASCWAHVTLKPYKHLACSPKCCDACAGGLHQPGLPPQSADSQPAAAPSQGTLALLMLLL